jgi:hypothetical protein
VAAEPVVTERAVAEPAVVETPAPVPAATTPPALVEPDPPVQVPADEVAAPVAADVVAVTPAEPTVAEPVVATPAPAAVVTGLPAVAPDKQVVYVEPTEPPRKRGNRGLGVLIALAGTVVFAAAYAVALVIVKLVRNQPAKFDFVTASSFWIPVVFFAIGFIILVLIANRASWWAYILGSLFVAVFVYFGSVITFELVNGVTDLTINGTAKGLGAELVSPRSIIAFFLAREVALWVGAGIAATGRRVKIRNAERHASWEEDEAAKKADRDATWPASA